jgi:hypothetical protein
MIVSDKTYTDLSYLTEEQREFVVGVYQQWLDESGYGQEVTCNNDLDVNTTYKYCLILPSVDKQKAKVFVGYSAHTSPWFQEVTYEEIVQDASGTSIDSRIEYWYKVCDLINKHTEDLELLDKVSKAPEDTCIGDAALAILEEALQLRQNKRKQEIEDAEYAAKKAEEELVKDIIDRWTWDFDELGFSIWFNESEKVFEMTEDTGKFPSYKASNEIGVEHIHKALDSLDDYL